VSNPDLAYILGKRAYIKGLRSDHIILLPKGHILTKYRPDLDM